MSGRKREEEIPGEELPEVVEEEAAEAIVEKETAPTSRPAGLSHLVIHVLVLGAGLLAWSAPEGPEVYRYFFLGRTIVDTSEVPRRAVGSYTRPDTRWTDTSWGFHAAAHVAHSVHSELGFRLLRTAMVMGTYALFLVLLLRLSGSALLAACLGILATCAAPRGLLQATGPELASHLFVALFLFLLARHRRQGGSLVYATVPAMALWVNCHQGFVFGLLLVACAFLGDLLGALLRLEQPGPERATARLWTLLLAGALAAGSCLATPYGHGLLSAAGFETALNVLAPGDRVWTPLVLADVPLYEVLLGIAGVGLVLSGRALQVADLLALAVFIHLSILGVQFLPPAVLVVSTLAAAALGTGGSSGGRLQAAAFRLVGVALAALCALALPSLLRQVAAPSPATPVPRQVVKLLDEGSVGGRIFHDRAWGDYLMYARYPEPAAFIDGRTDVYGTGFLKRFEEILAGAPRDASGKLIGTVFARHGIDVVLVRADPKDPNRPAIKWTLGTDTDTWQQIPVETAGVLLFVRKRPRYKKFWSRFVKKEP